MAKGTNLEKKAITLVGVPCKTGAAHAGVAMGPAALRIANLKASLQDLGHDVEDQGDVVPNKAYDSPTGRELAQRLRRVDRLCDWIISLQTATSALLDGGRIPILLGGDHSFSIGSVDAIAAHARRRGRKLFVLWLDAHTDFNTPLSSPSGNLHGMPVAALCREKGTKGLFDRLLTTPLSPAQIMVFGARSIDPREGDLLRRRGLEVIDMRRIDEQGVHLLLQDCLTNIAQQKGLLHVSLDADFLDPSIAPGVSTPVAGGVNYREAHLIMELLHESGLVVSLDIAELNPFLDVQGKTALLLVELVASLMGKKINSSHREREKSIEVVT